MINYSRRRKGYFGQYGGRYVPEILINALDELEKKYMEAKKDWQFLQELSYLLKNYAGRPTPLYFAKRLTEYLSGAKIYLKREDLCHLGAHKINNTLGQILLAKKMGKKNIIAETGAGQHGVSTAAVCALFGLKCKIFMGQKDISRQALNVFRMKLLGAQVYEVNSGSKTLKDAVNEAIRYWVSNIDSTYYVLGSVVGPHPYPTIVRDFQKIIGVEAKKQVLSAEGRLPDYIIACVGGGSNAAGGEGISGLKHGASLSYGKKGTLQGSFSYLLQDNYGQIREAHSISAGLDYPGVGPEHAYLKDNKLVEYENITDMEALEAFKLLCRLEGIIPALESAHPVAYALKIAPGLSKDKIIIVNLSGRGDKDIDTAYSIINGSI